MYFALQIQAGLRKNPQMYSLVNVHAVSSIQNMKFCTRLLCAHAKTSPDLFFFA